MRTPRGPRSCTLSSHAMSVRRLCNPSTPFDARGLYQDAVLGMDEFAAERKGIALFHELVEHVITGGQRAGEFVINYRRRRT